MRLPKQPYSKQDQNNDRKFVITVFHPVLNRQQHREEKLFSFELEIKREENNKKTHKILIKQTFSYYGVCTDIPSSV